MPVYVYKCASCKQTFEKRHGMFFEQDRCIYCQSENIFKVPSIQTVNRAKDQKNMKSKPGKIVDKYIEDVKKEVKEEKRKLSSEEI